MLDVSGIVYELIGELATDRQQARFPDSVLQKFRHGFPVDWEQLIRANLDKVQHQPDDDVHSGEMSRSASAKQQRRPDADEGGTNIGSPGEMKGNAISDGDVGKKSVREALRRRKHRINERVMAEQAAREREEMSPSPVAQADATIAEDSDEQIGAGKRSQLRIEDSDEETEEKPATTACARADAMDLTQLEPHRTIPRNSAQQLAEEEAERELQAALSGQGAQHSSSGPAAAKSKAAAQVISQSGLVSAARAATSDKSKQSQRQPPQQQAESADDRPAYGAIISAAFRAVARFGQWQQQREHRCKCRATCETEGESQREDESASQDQNATAAQRSARSAGQRTPERTRGATICCSCSN